MGGMPNSETGGREAYQGGYPWYTGRHNREVYTHPGTQGGITGRYIPTMGERRYKREVYTHHGERGRHIYRFIPQGVPGWVSSGVYQGGYPTGVPWWVYPRVYNGVHAGIP